MYYDSSTNLVYVGTNKDDIVVVEIAEVEGSGDGKLAWVKGVVKKKSFARAMQIFVDCGLMYVVNSDKTI